MAKGYWRRHRYIIRYKDGKRMPTSSIREISRFIKRDGDLIEAIETETGDLSVNIAKDIILKLGTL